MESFGHKIFISSQPVPLTGTGVLYPRVQDFFLTDLLVIGAFSQVVVHSQGAQAEFKLSSDQE